MSIFGPTFAVNFFSIFAVLWVLFWKGYSLWIAAKNSKKRWFLALLILNTFGILEIIYIFYVEKKTWHDIKQVLSKKI